MREEGLCPVALLLAIILTCLACAMTLPAQYIIEHTHCNPLGAGGASNQTGVFRMKLGMMVVPQDLGVETLHLGNREFISRVLHRA